MSSSINELKERLSGLKNLGNLLQADTRFSSTALEQDSANDPLVCAARKLNVPLLQPLTIGTLLASVLGEIDSDENALNALTHHQTSPKA